VARSLSSFLLYQNDKDCLTHFPSLFHSDKDEWELLADKGIRVLKQALTQLYVCTNGVEGPAAYTQWMASAKGVIKV